MRTTTENNWECLTETGKFPRIDKNKLTGDIYLVEDGAVTRHRICELVPIELSAELGGSESLCIQLLIQTLSTTDANEAPLRRVVPWTIAEYLQKQGMGVTCTTTDSDVSYHTNALKRLLLGA